jgi:hypothetical protein
MIGRFSPRRRHLLTATFDNRVLEHRKRLAKRLEAYRPAPSVKVQKSLYDGPDGP